MKKTLVMIGGGVQQINAVQSAQESGYLVLVTDRSESAPCFKYADYIGVIDGRNIEALIAYLSLRKEELNIVGIFTLTEMVTSVAAVASALNLPSVPLISAVNCQNKQLSKKCWEILNISTPYGKVIKNKQEGVNFLDKINKNAFIKPTVGFGSLGARQISSKEDLKNVDFKSKEYLIEEYINGSMHDVNGVFNKNEEFIPLGCFDRIFDKKNMIEKSAIYPSQLSESLIEKAYKLTETAARALGIKWGPVKSDLVLLKNEFLCLELACRLHGPKGTILLSSMVDHQNHLQRTLDIISGKTNELEKNIFKEEFASYEIIPHPGYPFQKITGIKKIENKGYKVLILNKKSNANIYSNNTDIIGYIFGKNQCIKKLKTNLKSMIKYLNFI